MGGPGAGQRGEAVRTPLPLRACAAEGTMSDEVAGLGPDLSNEAWQAEIARREGELRPTDEEFGPCKVSTPHRKPPKKPPVAPRRGVSTNPDKIGARRAIQMGQRASGGTTLDAAVLLLRAASDPAL